MARAPHAYALPEITAHVARVPHAYALRMWPGYHMPTLSPRRERGRGREQAHGAYATCLPAAMKPGMCLTRERALREKERERLSPGEWAWGIDHRPSPARHPGMGLSKSAKRRK